MQDLRQSDNWANYMESLGWEVLSLGGDFGIGYLKKFLGIFTIIKIQRPKEFLGEKEIDELARKYRAVLVKIEPTYFGQNTGETGSRPYRKYDNWPLLPPSEIHLNISLPEEDILKSFSENARRNIRKCQNAKLKAQSYEIADENALKRFWEILKLTGEKRGFFVESFSYLEAKARAFKDSGFLVLITNNQIIHPDRDVQIDGKVEEKGQILSGVFVLIHNKMAYYHFAATSEDGSKTGAPYFALWQVVLEAKKRGNQIFNLEGVYDPRFIGFTKKWKGFTEFKSRFGGWKVEYPGSFSRWYLFGHRIF